MTLLAFDGFEAGLRKPIWEATNATITTGSVRTGSYGMNIGGAVTRMIFPSAVATMIWGCAVKIVSANQFTIWGDGGTTQHMTITLNPTTGLIELRRGTSGGTFLASFSVSPPGTSTYNYFECKATINDTTGTCIVRWNGVEIINFTGDTKNGGTNSTIDYAGFSSNTQLDDVYLLNALGSKDNDFLGDVKIVARPPTGNGSSSQLVGSDGNSTDNYLQVDEVPPNTTDYNGSATIGNRDLYASSTSLPTNISRIVGVQATAYCAKSDSGAGNVKVITRAGSGTVTSPGSQGLAVTPSYAMFAGPCADVDPDGADWTKANVEASQYGVEVA